MNKNKSGFISMTLVYTFLIIFLFLMLAILRTYNEKDKFLETIDEQINEDISANVKTRETIINRILEDNSPISEDEAPIRYFNIANSHFGNGNGLYYTDDINKTDENDDGKASRIYYFRGVTERNHLVFASYCWRILRTNEDGSLRIRYNGPYNNGKCKDVSSIDGLSITTIGKTKYNTNDYSDSEESLKYIPSDENKANNVKRMLDEWYRENITAEQHSGQKDYYSYKVADAIYCNDLSTYIDSSNNVVPGKYGVHNLVPEFINKNNKNKYDYDNISNKISFRCLNGAYDVNNDDNHSGLHELSYPIGTLTAQDVVLAGGYLSSDTDEYEGGRSGMENESYYLYTGYNYWTMTPYSNIDGEPKMVYVNSRGQLKAGGVNDEEYYVVPVISLKASTQIVSGHGTTNSPFIVK